MKDNYLPASALTDRSTQENPIDILIDDFEDGVRLRLPYPTISYLAMTTDFDFSAWMNSPAKFVDKWRLAMLIAKDEADDDMIQSVFEGGILYPIEEEEDNAKQIKERFRS